MAKAQEAFDVFDGFDEATVNGGGLYLTPGGEETGDTPEWDSRPPGNYLLEIKELFTKVSRKKETLFIAEFEIIESDVTHRRVGQKVSWVVNFSQDAAMGNVKGFLAAVMNEPAENLVKKDLMDAVARDQPMAGCRVRCVVAPIRTRASKPFSKHIWDVVA